jgi:hypothetical protein
MVIHNAETNEYTERDYTDAELAREQELKDAAAAAQAKSDARAAIATRLGLTAEELATLLG